MHTCEEWMKKSSLETFWNGIYLEDEEREDLKICEVTIGMREWRINNLEWIDREGRKRKIKLNFRHRKM